MSTGSAHNRCKSTLLITGILGASTLGNFSATAEPFVDVELTIIGFVVEDRDFLPGSGTSDVYAKVTIDDGMEKRTRTIDDAEGLTDANWKFFRRYKESEANVLHPKEVLNGGTITGNVPIKIALFDQDDFKPDEHFDITSSPPRTKDIELVYNLFAQNWYRDGWPVSGVLNPVSSPSPSQGDTTDPFGKIWFRATTQFPPTLPSGELDLTPTSLSFSPIHPSNGDIVNISAAIENLGGPGDELAPGGHGVAVAFYDSEAGVLGELIGTDYIGAKEHIESKSGLAGTSFRTTDVGKVALLGSSCSGLASGTYIDCKLREIRLNVTYDSPFIYKPELTISTSGISAANPNSCVNFFNLLDEKPDGFIVSTFVLYIGFDAIGNPVKKWIPSPGATFSYTAVGTGLDYEVQTQWDTTGRSGDHEIIVIVNPDQSIAEIDFENNLLSAELSVAGLLGDLNADDKVDFGDYALLRSMLGKCAGDTGYNSAADFDKDGCISYQDYRIWYGYYRSGGR